MTIEEKERIINYMIYKDREATIKDYIEALHDILDDRNPQYVVKRIFNKETVGHPYYVRSLAK
jgi:hypothetical protein